ncbi:DUF302 domain-containing protein [Mycolicibacterium hodleri]|uniref:DUF302 domain-containing protein n=1 Tax=Mycolicibacterium hodleri TaxID=49897 RepID=A0A502DMB5_9MYCO|nr:DUF302 domain-containing protein [Mycolicibacterium hodleri]TPG25629.1 DUF302 domain-containing protein [Mycolicibacterium hodleri]
MLEIAETTVSITRVTVSSGRPFDEVVAAVYAGLGRVPDFGELVARWSAARDAAEFETTVGAATGSSGLIEFLSLDLGAVLTMRDPARSRRLLRIIAGNPVTMSSMAASVPDVGSYAPVTILVAERAEGTTLSYDRVASAIAPYASDEATAIAEALDAAVLVLLHNAAA